MFSTSHVLRTLDLSSNNLLGSIPDTLGDLPALFLLDLSHNRLVGQVPQQLQNLQQLQYLNLSRNGLSGQVPAALSRCVKLISLNLSYNKLSGDVPMSLANLSSLNSLDLSYNGLTGSLPQRPLFQNPSISNFAGNPGLIVHRATNFTVSSTVTTSKSNFNRKTLFIGLIVAVSVVVAAILAILYWKRAVSSFKETNHFKVEIWREKYLKVTAQELREATDNFSQEKIIGSGSMSIVYQARLPRSGNPVVAVKVLKVDVTLNAEARFKREMQLLAKVRHRNIVRIYGCCINLEIKALILELIPNGNLAEHCYGAGMHQTPLTMEEKLHILRGVAYGLHYLHDLHPDGPIVHCDLKPENILLDADLEPHITDFGISKFLDGNDYEVSKSVLLRGSLGYIPPEYGYICQVTTKGDVYSFGVIMLELLTGKRPTMITEELEEVESLVSWARSAYLHNEVSIFNTTTLTQQVANTIIQVALMCTNDLPSNRPTMHEVVHILTSL